MTAVDTTTNAGPVALVTLGCPKNEVDSDRMRARLESHGYEITDDLATARIAIVNTCGFIQDAVEESIAETLDLAEWRDAQPGRLLVVAGCMVSRYGDGLSDSLDEADAFVPVCDEPRIAEIVDVLVQASETNAGAASTPRPAASPANPAAPEGTARTTTHGSSAYLMISDGCSRACSFCTIPAIRGPYRSVPYETVLDEARMLIASGVRELVLIGQDTSSWGRDLTEGRALADLVAGLAVIDGLSWLRLLYVQPDSITDELLETMAAHPTVCRYLDIPLQHSSGSVLRAMNRTGSAEEFLPLLARIRGIMPDVTLRTSLITGFPGESRSDFEGLLEFVERAAFDYVGVFPYSPEPGTRAVDLERLPAKRTRLARAQRLRDVADAVSTSRVSELEGARIDVLVDGVDEEGVCVGRWRGQAPEIDGVVLLDRHVPAGDIVPVRVTGTLLYDLEGEVLT